MVEVEVEGGSTLFPIDYFGKKIYMTQSSQFYLEACLPSLGNVFCIHPSFRAEASKTSRHLSEFTHVEGELGFIQFDDLLRHIENLVKYVYQALMTDTKTREILKKLNPDLHLDDRPFIRMSYADAIKACNDFGIHSEVTGEPLAVGDDMTDAVERALVERLGHPVFVTGFPPGMKAFYMSRSEHNREETESVDLLMPAVGETVGGSMRIMDHQELMDSYQKNGLKPEPYYWYNDQRRYGTVSHGGYGLGLERLVRWLTNSKSVRDCTCFPRYFKRSSP